MINKNGFIMQSRGPEVDELMKDPYAFVLLTQIARRARRTNKFNRLNLKPGEALIGDHDSIGLSQANYRSAKRRLETYGLATFKPTNRGTVATLTDSTIYDINISEGNKPNSKQATSNPQATNEPADKQPTTNNNDNNDNKGNNEEKDSSPPDPISTSDKPDDGPQHKPDSLDAVKDYFKKNQGSEAMAEDFYDYYASQGWVKTSGVAIMSWQASASQWIRREKHNPPEWKQKSASKEKVMDGGTW